MLCLSKLSVESQARRDRYIVGLSLSSGVMACCCRALFVSFCVAGAIASEGGVPVVDVSLASPEAPPALVSTIAGFDATRESFEGTAAASDARAFKAALHEARPRIDAVAKQAVRALMSGSGRASSSSFLGSDRGGAVIEVDVATEAGIDASAVITAARALEAKWATTEAQDFSARLADFNVLTDAMVQSSNAAVHFLLAGQGRTAASFVAMPVAVAAGPSAAAIAGMEARRDIGEALGRAKHLNLALALIHRENGMLRAALRREVAAARSSGASFMGVSSAETLGQYVINLQPPQEDIRDVDAAIDGIMLAERAKQRVADAHFSEEKRRALEVRELALQKFARSVHH